MRKVFATDLGIWPVFQNLNKVSDAMVASSEIKRSLANYILLYDQIFIPTGNLQILPVLRILLGEDIFDELGVCRTYQHLNLISCKIVMSSIILPP
ncbi:hypothetical protein [Methylobacter luteus]|uniref:hypothetical protein n=1 Tax=Methylobacter luteus TaxID=415 RepID=UPI0004132E95|nr:hypothetical protein [Methylobacter luteus]